jgi:hypothetical protein
LAFFSPSRRSHCLRWVCFGAFFSVSSISLPLEETNSREARPERATETSAVLAHSAIPATPSHSPRRGNRSRPSRSLQS